MTENIVGKRLLKLRTRKGYTQEFIGNHLYVTASTIGHWENGRRRPSYEELMSICQLFNVSIEYFFRKEVEDE